MPQLGWLLVASLGVFNPVDSTAIDRFVRDQMRRAHIPGAFVAVLQRGRTLFARAYGTADLEWRQPVRPTSPFQIASVTKLMTSVVIASLADEGKIALDDPVTRYLPNAPPAWKEITLRQLAQHISGMAPAPVEATIATTAEGVAAAAKIPLATEPGRRSQYGSLDYTVLQSVIEQVVGQPFPVVLQTRVLDRIGARCSGFDQAKEDGLLRSADPIAERVTTYQWSGSTNRRVWFLYPAYTYAAGGLFMCGADLIRFLVAIDRARLLSRARLEELWTAPRLADSSLGEFGVGWVVSRYRGRKVVGHSGGPALADVMYLPAEQLGIVVLTNQLKLIPQLAEGIADLVLPAERRTDPAGVADSAPAITATFERVLRGMAAGKLDSAWFTASAQRQLLPALVEFGPVSVGLFDPLSRLVLVEDAVAGSFRRRRYRATFGAKVVEYEIQATTDGRLDSFAPRRR